ncbi:SPOR domain-containing protein [Pelagerythrobacter sp.]|uniref:SPOR domain-containing protein n=1 Tax=Pelagerythrobacter sp. TaxID=2800702 RepID=UPI0035B178B5
MMGRRKGHDGEEPTVDEWSEDETVVETEELELADGERLPWLESADYEEEPGVDTGRIFGFALLGLLAIGAVLGAIWYFGNRTSDPELVADGSTIEAPEAPYKERPENPGGRIAAGTGDVAPVVGEGRTPEGRLAQTDAPTPSETAAGSDEAGGVAVQVGAFSSSETAERGWATLTRQTEALNGVSHRVVEGQADIGKVFRLQAIAGDVAAARQLCSALQADGVACQVKR